jgi:hypothetical protein
MVVGGYQDVPAGVYAEFLRSWLRAAAGALAPAAYLAVVTDRTSDK